MKNTHKVPAKQWRKWSAPAQEVFNGLYAEMLAQPDFFTHPNDLLLKRHWPTTAWNAAWRAADLVDGQSGTLVAS